ncbi:SulP family inorganic anion transporter [Nocardioides sp. GXZ039]|uniref:SulP family inorganic anion transporter n=1 Tax=Nocardioides sp. GXZ039 TaxID=3136018 RepID=UPI0030F4A3C6
MTRPGIRRMLGRDAARKDVVAGTVLGLQSVPDGLAAGLLAGVSPLAGLYAYLFGMVGAAAVTSSGFLTVQATGAMALIVADTPAVHRLDPERSMATLGVLTGIILVGAGLLKVGRLVRFTPVPVMTGFLAAVGANIVIGQLPSVTGFDASGDTRLTRLFDTLARMGQWSAPAVFVSALTMIIIVLTHSTRFAGPALVVAVVVGSGVALVLNQVAEPHVETLSDLVAVPSALPLPVLPDARATLDLLLPALSLALVCTVQGAGVSAGLPNPGSRQPDPSRDVVGQGVGNLVSALLRGMPVGGSLSASMILVQAGARSRVAIFVAGGVMALTVVFAADLVAHTATPALGGLLLVVGILSIDPARIRSVTKTGPFHTAVMAVTFVLTVLIPLQFAVLVGIGLGIILFVAEQSNRVIVRRLWFEPVRRIREGDPPATLPAHDVVVLQPYGSLFFASAPNFEAQLPKVGRDSRGSVVVLRLRGVGSVDLAVVEVLRRYVADLHVVGSTLKIVASDQPVLTQLEATGFAAELGEGNLYRGGDWVGRAVRQAYGDAIADLARRAR